LRVKNDNLGLDTISIAWSFTKQNNGYYTITYKKAGLHLTVNRNKIPYNLMLANLPDGTNNNWDFKTI
jgi:hypothetical protein